MILNIYEKLHLSITPEVGAKYYQNNEVAANNFELPLFHHTRPKSGSVVIVSPVLCKSVIDGILPTLLAANLRIGSDIGLSLVLKGQNNGIF